jgi:hypothetical protein
MRKGWNKEVIPLAVPRGLSRVRRGRLIFDVDGVLFDSPNK